MPLHPQARALLDQNAAERLAPFTALTPDEARARMRASSPALGSLGSNLHISNRAIPGPAGPIPIRLYVPPADAPRPLPALVYFHGGCWVLGDLDTHDALCRSLAEAAGAIVVAVDYRLAPEHRFPAAVEDAYAATLWTLQHAPEIGADLARVSVGGDSAGGNLAAVVALMARDRRAPRLASQILIYPIVDHDVSTPSYLAHADGFGLTRAEMIWGWDHYLPDPAARDSPYASPLRAPDLSGLPPTLLLTAEYDVLRDEAEAYADRLKEAGVPVTLTRSDGMIHGFVRRLEIFDSAHDALTQIARSLCLPSLPA